MDLFLLGGGVLLIGVVLVVAGVGLWFVYRRQQRAYRVAQGVVISIDADSSSRMAVIEFSPGGEILVGGQPYRLREGLGAAYHLGDSIAVRYDPARPSEATILRPIHTRTLALVMGLIGVLQIPTALFVMLFLAPQQRAQHEALARFLSAARSKNSAQVVQQSTPTAQIERPFLDAAERSRGQVITGMAGGFSDACFEVRFDGGSPFYVYLRRDQAWRVARARQQDTECRERIESR
ncbi:MAG: DUF3592 domain-containing protein [Polyangiaceae bacterium]